MAESEYPCEGAEYGVCGGPPHTDDCPASQDVKRALLRDIDAGKVFEDGSDPVFLYLGADGEANVSTTAWTLHRDGLAEPGASADANGWSYWRLTDAGRAYLEAGTDG